MDTFWKLHGHVKASPAALQAGAIPSIRQAESSQAVISSLFARLSGAAYNGYNVLKGQYFYLNPWVQGG